MSLMASVELLVVDVGLWNETFQKECECAGSDFVYECSIKKTKNKNSFSSSFCQPITQIWN